MSVFMYCIWLSYGVFPHPRKMGGFVPRNGNCRLILRNPGKPASWPAEVIIWSMANRKMMWIERNLIWIKPSIDIPMGSLFVYCWVSIWIIPVIGEYGGTILSYYNYICLFVHWGTFPDIEMPATIHLHISVLLGMGTFHVGSLHLQICIATPSWMEKWKTWKYVVKYHLNHLEKHVSSLFYTSLFLGGVL